MAVSIPGRARSGVVILDAERDHTTERPSEAPHVHRHSRGAQMQEAGRGGRESRDGARRQPSASARTFTREAPRLASGLPEPRGVFWG